MRYGKNRGIITFAVFFVCLAIFGSFFMIFAGSGHECTHDDDCEVCRMIDMCIHTVRFAAVAAAVIAAVFCAVTVFRAVFPQIRTVPAATLISLKTELRD